MRVTEPAGPPVELTESHTVSKERRVARVVVNVMPKAEILDPQGQAIVGALGRLGHSGISDVRQGKRFEFDVDDTVDDGSRRDRRIVVGQHRDRGLDRR